MSARSTDKCSKTNLQKQDLVFAASATSCHCDQQSFYKKNVKITEKILWAGKDSGVTELPTIGL